VAIGPAPSEVCLRGPDLGSQMKPRACIAVRQAVAA
jgi:hypothetical protein